MGYEGYSSYFIRVIRSTEYIQKLSFVNLPLTAKNIQSLIKNLTMDIFNSNFGFTIHGRSKLKKSPEIK